MKCSFCETEEKKYIYIMHHEILGMDLCERCTDKLLSWVNNRNIDDFWSAEDATKAGYNEFPRLKLWEMNKPYYVRRMELMVQVQSLDYNERKRKERL